MTREGGSHFKLGYRKYLRESETMDRFMGEKRHAEVLEALSKRTEPESMKLGTTLRTSSVALGMRTLSGPINPKSEARDRYRQFPIVRTIGFQHLGEELRKANIDHAYGQDKGCSHWKPAGQDEMSKHAAEKFACGVPQGFQHLAKELRRSNVPMCDGSYGKNRTNPLWRSEAVSRFTEQPMILEKGYSDTLGKDLRESHISIGSSKERSARDWIPVTRSSMTDHAEEKWSCTKPQGFEELGVELRKSSVPLSGAGQDFMCKKPTGWRVK